MRINRSLAVVVAAAVVAGLVTAPADAATTYDAKPTATGSRWLPDQLTGGIVHNQEFDFDDYGLTIDVAFALDAVDRKPTVVQQIGQAVAANVTSYTNAFGGDFAGNFAKAAVLAIVTHHDPRAFGGDLITQLEDHVSSTAPIAGRIEDGPPFSDSANVFGQAHAARALSFAGSSDADAVTAFLLQQQCAAGFFRQDFTADKTAVDQSCDGAPSAAQPSVDATALAVLSLKGIAGAEVQAAVRKAVSWLADNQRRNGSFSDRSKAVGKSNANSTGLAGWALGASSKTNRASHAAVWVRNLQAGAANPCSGRLAHQTGAIALDQAGYADGQRTGIRRKTSDQWRRASAQALPVLRWAPRAEGAFTAQAPRTARVGSKLRIALTGVAPGQRVCVKDRTSTREFRSGLTATKRVLFRLKGDPGLRTVRVFLGGKRRDLTVRVTR